MTSVGMMASGVLGTTGRTVLNDPCDNFTFAPWTIAGSVTVSASGHTGNGFSFPTGTTHIARYNLAAGDQTDTLTVGCWLKLGTLVATQNVLVFGSDAGATDHVALRVGTNGAVSAFRIAGATLGASSAAGTITAGTWYFVELQIRLHDTLGTAIIRVDGAEVVNAAAQDTKNGGTKTVFDQISYRSVGATTAWLIDDVYIRNDSTFGP